MRSVVVLLLLFASLLSAQVNPIEVTPKNWDFGNIKDLHSVRCVFTLRNNTQEEVKLSNLDSPCGCVVFAPHPDVVPAGGEAKVHVEFNPKGRRGPYNWEVEIATSLKEFPKITIPLSANVLRDGLFSEDSVNFKIFKRGEPKEFILLFVYRQQKDFKLTSATTTCEHFDVNYQETQVSDFFPGPQRGYKIIIRAHNNIPLGRHNEHLKLHTNIPQKEKILLPIWAYVTGDIVTAPDYVSFGLLIPGKPKKRQVKIYHKNLEKFKITKVESDLPFVTTEIEAKIPEEYYYLWITLNCPAGLKPGEFRGMINVYTSYPSHKIAPVHIQGFVRGQQDKKAN